MVRKFLELPIEKRWLAVGWTVLTVCLVALLLQVGLFDSVDSFIRALPLAAMNIFGFVMVTTPVTHDYAKLFTYRRPFWFGSLFIWAIFAVVVFVLGPLFGIPIGREQAIWILAGFLLCQLIRIAFWYKPKRWLYYYGTACMLYSAAGLYLVLIGLI